jgi:hypothetical protein
MRDAPQMLSSAQSVTTVACSTYSYDQLAANKETGHGGKPVVAHVRVHAAFTGAASGVRIYLVDDSVEGLTSPRVLALLCSQNVSGGDTHDAAGVTPSTPSVTTCKPMCRRGSRPSNIWASSTCRSTKPSPPAVSTPGSMTSRNRRPERLKRKQGTVAGDRVGPPLVPGPF